MRCGTGEEPFEISSRDDLGTDGEPRLLGITGAHARRSSPSTSYFNLLRSSTPLKDGLSGQAHSVVGRSEIVSSETLVPKPFRQAGRRFLRTTSQQAGLDKISSRQSTVRMGVPMAVLPLRQLPRRGRRTQSAPVSLIDPSIYPCEHFVEPHIVPQVRKQKGRLTPHFP
jgi:hypothetical protein